MRIRLLAVLVTAAFLAGQAGAALVVAVDVDPATAGVQSSRDVGLSGTFEVDVIVLGIEAPNSLNAFEFDLLFDPTFVEAVSIMDGGFLLDDVFEVQSTIGASSVEFAEVTLGAMGASGGGVLATIVFAPVSLGTSTLDLGVVILSAPLGLEIATDSIDDATVSVVPEPTTALLVAVGLGCLAARGRLPEPRPRRA